ncbi:hypothetical protein MCRY_22150 [Marivita cryptomonadis]|nr:hypothetical protein MCRY_22150 [Marivita cryptomonadis]
MKASRNNHPAFIVDFDFGHDLEIPLRNLNGHYHNRIFGFIDGDRQDNIIFHRKDTLLGESNQWALTRP